MLTERPQLTIVVPAFNEAAILERNLKELFAYLERTSSYSFEVVLVNDGSTDKTASLAQAFAAAQPGLRVFHHFANRGLGAALRTGFAHARGGIVVVLDLDLSYAPGHIAALLRGLSESGAAIAVASPYVRGGSVRNVPLLRRWMSAWANRFLSIATGGAVATLTGMVRAYDARALRGLPVNTDGMEVNHELIFAALRQGLRIVEVPAQLHWRDAAASPTGARAAFKAANAASRRSSMRIASHLWSVLASGFRYRPSMVFVIPGLIPGLLPLVLLLLVLVRPSHATIVNTTLATMAVQGLSLGFLAVLTGSYVKQLRSLGRPTRLQETGTQISG
jgi:glycosyltransferase involved in cell wall biosynthesis